MIHLTRRVLPLLLCAFTLSVAAQTQDTGISIPNMDPAVRPGDNFYLYTNGGYIKRTELPADRSFIGVFSVLSDRSFKQVASIIEDATKSNAPAGSNEGKIADLYRSFMNEDAIEAHGLAALKPHLAEIAAIHTQRELAHTLGSSLRADVDALNATNFQTANIFGLWVAPSFNDPDHYAPYLLQGGLELPNRDYYLSDSASMKEIRTKYLTHIAAMFRLAGLADPDTRAARVLALETAIAKVQLSLADSEDIHKANNPWRPADFTAKAPGLDWPSSSTPPASSGNPPPSPANRPSSPRSPSTHGKTSSPITSSRTTPSQPPKPWPTRASPSSAPPSPEPPSDVPVTSAAMSSSPAPSATRSARSTSNISSPPKPKPRPTPSSPTSSPPFASVSKT